MAPDRRRVVHLTKPVFWDEAALHSWDLSPDRTQQMYEYGHGCKSMSEFEIRSVLRFFAEIRCVARRCALVVLFGLSRVILCLSRMLFGLGGIRHK
jgi:hypothetical protein